MRLDLSDDRRIRVEPLLPMINVVFLLLVFFLIAARIAPPEPLEVSLPEAEGRQPAEAPTLWLDAAGQPAFGDARGHEALAAFSAACAACRAGERPEVVLRADGRAPAVAVARLLADLSAAGAGTVAIATTAP
ncbi:MAG: biopolymer transporter ExbD [Gemmobacter sp.]